MTEREFDDFFKDRIGDEQPFEFRSDDWFAAAHELDKVLPVAAPVAVVPPPRFLAWHKCAAAAAILVLASQAWLMNKMSDLKQEVVTLKKENVSLTQQKDLLATETRRETIVQYDTIVKTIVIESPIQAIKLFQKNNQRVQSADYYVAENKSVAPGKTYSNDKPVADKTTDKFEKSNNAVVNNPINQVEKNDLITSDKKDNNIAQNDTFNTSAKLDNSILKNAVRDNAVIAALPLVEFEAVQSNRRNIQQLELMEAVPIVQPKVKPTLFLNGWTLGVNSLWILNKQRAGKDKKNSDLDNGFNARLTYQLKSNWRLAADVDFWSETRPHPDSSHRSPFQPPSPDYNLSRVDLKSKKVQIRVGADYEFVNKSIVTPFVGMGLAYVVTTQDDIEYQFKSPRNPTIPVAVHKDKMPDSKNPLYLSLRAGLSGTFYKRLGWSLNVAKELPFNGPTNRLLSGQVGLVYAL